MVGGGELEGEHEGSESHVVEGPGCGRPEWFCGTDLAGEKAGRQNQPRGVCAQGAGAGGRGGMAFPWPVKYPQEQFRASKSKSEQLNGE